jgi:hypothetical protein
VRCARPRPALVREASPDVIPECARVILDAHPSCIGASTTTELTLGRQAFAQRERCSTFTALDLGMTNCISTRHAAIALRRRNRRMAFKGLTALRTDPGDFSRCRIQPTVGLSVESTSLHIRKYTRERSLAD